MSNEADSPQDRLAGRAARLARVRAAKTILIFVTAIGLGACAGVPSSPQPSQSPTAPLQLVAIGDSIPNNSPGECPGCQGFVDRYAAAIHTATKEPVKVQNLSEHNNLTLPGLLDELPDLKDQLGAADIIVIGIAHNSMELNAHRPCGGAVTNELPDWSKLTPACAKAAAARYQPQFDTLFKKVAAARAGKPTVLRTINRYNDWIGWPDGTYTSPRLGRRLPSMTSGTPCFAKRPSRTDSAAPTSTTPSTDPTDPRPQARCSQRTTHTRPTKETRRLPKCSWSWATNR